MALQGLLRRSSDVSSYHSHGSLTLFLANLLSCGVLSSVNLWVWGNWSTETAWSYPQSSSLLSGELANFQPAHTLLESFSVGDQGHQLFAFHLSLQSVPYD